MIRQESAASRVRKRDACDRCHEMKSRCHKSPGSSSCIRCERSGGQCHFSEALRAGRPKKRATSSLKQEPSPPSLEPPRINEENAPVDIQHEASSVVVENGMDMLNFASPLPDFLVSPQSMDGHLDTATADSTFEGWMSVNPSDTQIAYTDDHDMSPFSSSVQLEPITPEQFRTGSSSISCASSGMMSSGRPGSEISSVISHDSIGQQLLYLHSTLQRILTVYNNGAVLSWDNAWTPQTAVEETFLATDKLVAAMESISPRSHPSTPQSVGTVSDGSTNGDVEHTTKPRSGADSASLLILSCYICALEVYQVQVDLMNEQVKKSMDESRNAAGQENQGALNGASSLNSSAHIMPVLNIGQFNLGMSPMRNLGVLLHLTQDMVDRLQSAVQHWSMTQKKSEEHSMHHLQNEADTSPTQSEFSRSRKDSVVQPDREATTRSAMSSVFDSVLIGVEARERMLKASIQDVKEALKRST